MVRVSGSVAPRGPDVQLLHVVALLVLRGDGALQGVRIRGNGELDSQNAQV